MTEEEWYALWDQHKDKPTLAVDDVEGAKLTFKNITVVSPQRVRLAIENNIDLGRDFTIVEHDDHFEVVTHTQYVHYRGYVQRRFGFMINKYGDPVLHHTELPAMVVGRMCEREKEYKPNRLTWYQYGLEHRDNDLPSEIQHRSAESSRPSSIRWSQWGLTHRAGKPAEMNYNADGEVIKEEWYGYDRPYRPDDLPTDIEYKQGKVITEMWYGPNFDFERGCFGPAEIKYSATTGEVLEEIWYKHGEKIQAFPEGWNEMDDETKQFTWELL